MEETRLPGRLPTAHQKNQKYHRYISLSISVQRIIGANRQFENSQLQCYGPVLLVPLYRLQLLQEHRTNKYVISSGIPFIQCLKAA